MIFRYCRSVKRCVALPELHKHSFEIIAFYAMRSAIGHEMRNGDGESKPSAWMPRCANTNHLTYKDPWPVKITSHFERMPANMRDKLLMLGRTIDAVMEIAEAAFAVDENGDLPRPCYGNGKRHLQIPLTAFLHTESTASAMTLCIRYLKAVAADQDAKTVQALKEIQSEPNPRYIGSRFIAGPACVPEEEMIFWSLASMKGTSDQRSFEKVHGTVSGDFWLHAWRGVAHTRSRVICMKIYVLIHEQDTESAWGSHVSLFLNRDLAEAEHAEMLGRCA